MAKERYTEDTVINAVGVLEYNSDKSRRELVIDGEVYDLEMILDKMEGNIIEIKCTFQSEDKIYEETTK